MERVRREARGAQQRNVLVEILVRSKSEYSHELFHSLYIETSSRNENVGRSNRKGEARDMKQPR